uniref:Uncharacterized protein n=1 Tax=Anguilla anguilla TaxID=7936 RepID=A0A0E9QHW3_ANGAN
MLRVHASVFLVYNFDISGACGEGDVGSCKSLCEMEVSKAGVELRNN